MINWGKRKYISPEIIEEQVKKIRRSNRTIATLNGCFDLLHFGHLKMLYEASQQADVLIVSLNSDRSIQKYKGRHRPILSLKERLEMISAFEWVDYVTYFDEIDPRVLLEKIKPDTHTNGSEYGKDCIEADIVKKNGGKIHIVERIPQFSTSQLIEKIKTCV